MIVSSVIFLITIIFVITRPKGLQIGTIAMVGAAVSLLFKTVSFSDVLIVFEIVWDATLSLIGIFIFSMVLERIGFFEWCALKLAKLSHNNAHLMFIYSLILGSLVSALFANDGAVLILIPINYHIMLLFLHFLHSIFLLLLTK